MLKDESPHPTVVAAVNEKGWMDQEMMNFWLSATICVLMASLKHVKPCF